MRLIKRTMCVDVVSIASEFISSGKIIRALSRPVMGKLFKEGAKGKEKKL